MQRLAKIAALDERLVVGLMSGTSADGIDAALVKIQGNHTASHVELLAFQTQEYPDDTAETVRGLTNGSAEQVCAMNFRLGELFAEAALRVIASAGAKPADVHLIGSHGQTIYHISDAEPRSTLQIGEPCVIAERTGITTVADFRTRDIASGGHGAPLIPYVDFILFRHPERVRALQNIGGMANVTVVAPSFDDVFGFDTGPGNVLIDEFVRIMTDGERQFDAGGAMAKAGSIERDVLQKLLDHPYLSQPPPKTTGRETFGTDLAGKLALATPPNHHIDMLATLTAFTAYSIKKSYDDFVFPKTSIDEIVLSGGGCQNNYLVESIRALFGSIPVRASDEFGIPSDAKEAIGFAVLANETICGNPSNVPAVTGASRPVVLGKIIP